MRWLPFTLLAFCSADIFCAELPDNWRPYVTGKADAQAQCRIMPVKDGIRIEDGSPAAEAGVCRNYPCKAGKFYRFIAAGTPVKPIAGMECTAYYYGKVRRRAGQAPIQADGSSVVVFGPVPEGAEGITFFYYSSIHAVNAVTLNKVKMEAGDQPFSAELPEVIAPPVAAAREIYIAPDGDDAQDGSANRPWKTLAKISQAGPGTTVIFRPGKYTGNLIPQHSGTKEAPIVYRAERPGKTVLTGGPKSEYAAVLKGKDHIILEGFRFEAPAGKRWLLVENARHCTIKNCHMEYSTVTNPIHCRNVHYCRFDHLNVFRCEARWIDGQVDGDMWNNYHVTHCVFSHLYISRAGHRPFGLWFDCEKNVIRDSIFDCRWGRNFEFFSPKGVLMERCVITNSYEGSGSADGRAKLFTTDGIFRYNVIMRNSTCPLVINAYRYQDMPPFGMQRSRLYFNTWYMNQDCGWQMTDMDRKDGVFMVKDNVVKNNIFADCSPEDGTALLLSRSIAPDNRFVSNLLRGRKPGDKTVKRPWPVKTYTAEEANAAMPDQFARNFDADPGFVNAEKDDCRLKPDSPARERGEALTVTAEAQQNSIFLAVEDAKYFYDGYGIPGEVGDLLYIGPDKIQARVTGKDPDQNILTLDRPVSFARGDAVNLAYTGKAPDPGAYQTGLRTGPEFDPAQVRQEKMDTAAKPVIACDFEETHPENWFIYWKWCRRINSSASVDRTCGANGSRGSWKVTGVKNSYGKNIPGSVLATHICPARWFIDRFPFVRFSYRIPKGTPVGIAVHEDSKTSYSAKPAQVLLGGTSAVQANGRWGTYENLNKVRLTDDGRWHTVTVDVRAIREKFPDVKMLSRFHFFTPGINGKIGDCYWIDDFAILPAKFLP